MTEATQFAAKLNDETCFLYLARHGETANNHAGRLQGQQGHHGLSETGVEQARRLGELLQARPIAAVYSSPLRRAMQTAEIVAAAYGYEVRPVPALMEVNVGRWEGRSWAEISASEPAAYAAFMDNPAESPYDGGETFTDVVDRVKPAMDTLFRAHLGEAIVVVAHSVVNRTYLASALGMPLRRADQLTHHNCAVSVLRQRHGKVQVVAMNSGFHLGEY
ncbi:MAG: histidine phosphatase family protein [Pirellulales bacterium]